MDSSVEGLLTVTTCVRVTMFGPKQHFVPRCHIWTEWVILGSSWNTVWKLHFSFFYPPVSQKVLTVLSEYNKEWHSPQNIHCSLFRASQACTCDNALAFWPTKMLHTVIPAKFIFYHFITSHSIQDTRNQCYEIPIWGGYCTVEYLVNHHRLIQLVHLHIHTRICHKTGQIYTMPYVMFLFR